jgi:hypothetical protein
MKKIHFIGLSFIFIGLSCKTPIVKTKTPIIQPYINPKYIALDKSLVIPWDTFKFEINSLIDTLIGKQNRAIVMANKQFPLDIYPDSCGNIIKVKIVVFPVGRDYTIVEKAIIDYVYSLKKINIFYRDAYKNTVALEIIGIYIRFNKNGVFDKFK